MSNLTKIDFGSVSFKEALRSLREMVPMTEDQFSALSAVAKQRAFSFAGAYSDSMAEAAQKVLEGVQLGEVPVNGVLDALNHALAPFGESVTPFQADTIFQTTMNRVFNQGNDEAFNNPGLVDLYPYIGHVTSDDIRVRPNHFAIDYRRIGGVFHRNDFIWSQMSAPLGFRCRCWKLYFRQEEIDAMGLQVFRGEDWYGKSVEVAVPGHGPVVCQCLPDPGFGTSGLTGSQTGVDTQRLVSLAVICLAASAEVRELVGGGAGQPRDSLGRWVDANGGGLSERHNIARGTRAVRRALRQKADVQEAMYRKDVGAITFAIGRPGSPTIKYQDGYGISHIAAKHGSAAALQLPVAIAKGKLYPHESDPNKRYLIHGNTLAVLQRENKKSAFVVTSYGDRKRTSIGGR